MKAEELMIGDWVNVFGIPKQLEGIRKFRYGDGVVYYDGDNGDFIENVTPIPLTPEILKKNGYKPNCWNQYAMHIENDVYVFIDNKYCIHGYDSQVIIHCQYVHQFQHALKLCGIEKEIQL